MHSQNDKTSLRRTGMRRLIAPWEHRHLRGVAYVRFAGGVLLLIFGGILLPYVFWWAALPLAAAVADFAWGYWYLTIARSSDSKTDARKNPETLE